MNKRFNEKRSTTDPSDRIAVLLSVIFFVSGIFVGTFSAGSIDETGSVALYGDINEYIEVIRNGSYVRADFLSAILSAYKYHLLVVFLGLSVPGFIIIPFLSGVRSFYLSFSIAAFIKVFGSGGALVAFGLFGLGALITIPCLFMLSAQSFMASYELWRLVVGKSRGTVTRIYGKRYFFRCGAVMAVLFFSVLLEMYVTPWFVSVVSVFL